MRVLRIDGEMTIDTAADRRTELLGFLGAGDEGTDDLQIDLSGVTDLDLAGLQVLLATKKECLGRRTRLVYTGHSPAVLETLASVRVCRVLDAVNLRAGCGGMGE